MDPSVPSQNIVLYRDSGVIRMNAPARPPPPHPEKVDTIYGLLGIIRLHAGDYLVAITERVKVGRLGRHDIYQLGAAKIYPFSRNSLHLREEQIRDEETFLALLDSVLHNGANYFSYTYDLTHTLQRQAEFGDAARRPLWRRADDRFFWNRHLMRRFADIALTNSDQDMSEFILPVIHGFVEIRLAEVKQRPFVYALISRRSRYRVGTRYFSRGVDAEGNVSNFVETEQIVMADPAEEVNPEVSSNGRFNAAVQGKLRMSYVQTRGSIPIFWAQITNLKYAPTLQAIQTPQTAAALRRHIQSQLHIYGPQTVVNLINKTGYEKKMADLFTRLMNMEFPPDKPEHGVHYIHWDFHTECKKMRWDRISLLIDAIQDQLNAQGYFFEEAPSATQPPMIRQKQNGSVRTNCMDCLDRTNVVQSVIARFILTRQLRQLGILSPNETVEEIPDLYHMFRNVWADNADAVSNAYSGTGALKTDFTRTGKRTKAGALQDLVNSIVRYVRNNYWDGSRQDAFDLFLGNYEVSAAAVGFASPFKVQRTLRYRVLPAAMLISITMIFSGFLYPHLVSATADSIASGLPILWISFWVAVLIFSGKVILQNGMEFADRPRLVQLQYGQDMPGLVDDTITSPVTATVKEL